MFAIKIIFEQILFPMKLKASSRPKNGVAVFNFVVVSVVVFVFVAVVVVVLLIDLVVALVCTYLVLVHNVISK